MVHRMKSKFGEGIGSKTELADDANEPTFDIATHKSSIDKLIVELLSDKIVPLLDKWELQFLMDIYGCAPLTFKQRKRVFYIHKKYISAKE